MSKSWLRNNLGLIILAIIGLVFLYAVVTPFEPNVQEVGITTVIKEVKNSEVESISISGNKLDITLNDGTRQSAQQATNVDILQVLSSQGVDLSTVPLTFKSQQMSGMIGDVLAALIPTLLIIGFIVFMMRQAGGGGGGSAFSFGRSKAKMYAEEGAEGQDKSKEKKRTKFEDVAALEEAKEELNEIVEFLKHPQKFALLGARIPRGVLLVGPPGTGKTLLARAVAGEAGVPFFSISGSEFVEMFVGVGASRVRDLFDQAKKAAPCIVFVDEIDAVGRHRGAGLGGGHDEREQTLNQILVEMDGFDARTNVIIMAATNRPDVLDPALLRPGRFDRQVILDRTDIKGRTAILNIHARGKPLAAGVNLELVAKLTPGFSGADLENVMNEAAILAARRDKKKVGMSELEEAVDRILAGPERKSKVVTETQKKLTAYHEAGHALVAKKLPNADPVHKISIIARGMAGGYTRFLPTEERDNWTRAQFKDMIAAMLAGHASEEIVFGDVTTGARDDLQRATRIARKMVTEYGMSDVMGPQAFGQQESADVFLGHDIMRHRDYSEDVARQIDAEVSAIMKYAYKQATDIIVAERVLLDKIASVLIEKETLEGEEFESFFVEPVLEPGKVTKVKRSIDS
ncbi:cell division protein FtsH [Candidatus Wirthbacteria bacterium CG2_30_54_11]|uniref:ATP-dependent zinc metalloprotease FtsH n=1 Tax=Candidatus Wirthbacteria bacterium CG2_30_54_11 TaxID=1817892 RepID=A0A1J5IR97_9BACT|nr:MAG: cell division protein FtsH [Candidatus Wirthbacteria bacterium CG2_30_54_11]